MNWDAAGAIGEMTGALAVVITLIVLVKETRANTRAVVSASSSRASYEFANFNTQLAQDPELARLFTMSFQPEMADWNDEDWNRFMFLARSEVGKIEDQWIQMQLGVGYQGRAENYVNFMRGLLEYPAWKKYWQDDTQDSMNWSVDFVKEVESRTPGHLGHTPFSQMD